MGSFCPKPLQDDVRKLEEEFVLREISEVYAPIYEARLIGPKKKIAIIKFSDSSQVYDLFLFSEILEKNREHLVDGKSFVLTVIKDKDNQDNRFRRINVRKIISLDKITKLNYDNVKIEMYNEENLEQLYKTIKEKGTSKIKISIVKEDKNYLFELKDKRKFDYETLKYLNKEQYIKKISL